MCSTTRQNWVREPFDRSRPLWQLGVFTGLADGRGALVLKLHHAIADGVGLMLMLAALADLEPNPRTDPAGRCRLRTGAHGEDPPPIGEIVRHPFKSLNSAARSVVSIARLVMPTRKPLSPLMTGRSAQLCLDTKALPFETLRNAGKQAGASLNDAFISLVLDTLDRYHKRHGGECDQVRIHMPINIRDAATADRAGNQFVPARIVMNVGDNDTEGRLRRVSKHLAAVRQEPALRWVNSVSAAIQRLGVPISRRIIGGMMKVSTCWLRTLPGRRAPCILPASMSKSSTPSDPQPARR